LLKGNGVASGSALHQRLMAILAADAAGYSRLMAHNERVTIDALDQARQVFERRIDEHFGRVVDMAGDSVLAVFETVSGAVDAAFAIQREFATEQTDRRVDSLEAGEDEPLPFRIGIHLGDVYQKSDGSVYGNGVNLAARLQALAPPGGISVSDAVRSAIAGRNGWTFQDLGLHHLKNITGPVHAYCLSADQAPRLDAEAGGGRTSPPLHEYFKRIPIGNCVLDVQTSMLSDCAGRAIPISPQALAVLVHLAINAGRTVGKEELLNVAWPGLTVAGSALVQVVGEARAALDSAGFDAIKTVPGRGYVLFAGSSGAIPQGPVAAPVRLPAAPSALFGREADLAAVDGMLARHRLITVVGAGGVGKTVLALAAAHAHRSRSGDAGVAWVELAPLDNALLLPSTIAAALGLPFGAGVEPLAGLMAALRPQQCLIVLDNAEHLVDAVAQLASAIVEAAPRVNLLVTSQAPLKIEAERICRLGGLALPALSASAAEARHAPAVAMFIDRARAVDHLFEADDAKIAIIVRICQRLDALPLAIRLGAAQVAMLGLDGLEAHLTQRLDLLASRARDGPGRQQTLRAALDWSYGLLSEHEARVFRAMGIFVGGFTINLVVAVCAAAARDGAATFEAVQVLAERSLIQSNGGDPPRWRLPESAREYALELLGAAGERSSVSLAHAVALAQAYELAEAEQFSLSDADWLARWAGDLDNLRAALDWATTSEPQLAVRLVWVATPLFSILALSEELRRRAHPLEAASESADRRVAGCYWVSRAHLQINAGDEVMRACAMRAEAIFRDLADDIWLYQVLCLRALSSLDVANEDMDALVGEIDRIERPGWPGRFRLPRFLLGFAIAARARRFEEALDSARGGLQLARSCGAMAWAGHFVYLVAFALASLRRNDEALRTCREGLSDTDIESPGAIVLLNGTMASCLLRLGRAPQARQALARLFELCRTLEWRTFDLFGPTYYKLALQEGRLATAAILLGYATIGQNRGWRTFDTHGYRERHRALLQTRMDPEAVERAFAFGATLDQEAVCALTLQTATATQAVTMASGQPKSGRGQNPSFGAGLQSPRSRQSR
jgi:predicted ATPase/class 3 adenylate cyclase/DNA-binding winged helix-turn-helix (wHTH) protein